MLRDFRLGTIISNRASLASRLISNIWITLANRTKNLRLWASLCNLRLYKPGPDITAALPVELQAHILSFLTVADHHVVSQTCPLWRDILRSRSFITTHYFDFADDYPAGLHRLFGCRRTNTWLGCTIDKSGITDIFVLFIPDFDEFRWDNLPVRRNFMVEYISIFTSPLLDDPVLNPALVAGDRDSELWTDFGHSFILQSLGPGAHMDNPTAIVRRNRGLLPEAAWNPGRGSLRKLLEMIGEDVSDYPLDMAVDLKKTRMIVVPGRTIFFFLVFDVTQISSSDLVQQIHQFRARANI
ncbi:hypothetical protein Dda_9384 [Drechslerella dactyloides]|uniref:F-box domain-containing protein n=1 Tax=Drechslerella dactyloides TaxID=74499 RepID=A0AAD6NF55_DREDA|nr:hypothetical protein Dda_9384 [Drechslerella dactyloides]